MPVLKSPSTPKPDVRGQTSAFVGFVSGFLPALSSLCLSLREHRAELWTNTGLTAVSNGARSALSFRSFFRLLAPCSLLLALSACSSMPKAYVEPPPLTAADRTLLNLKVHDAVWQLVNEKHFDPNHRGVDWAAMRTKYRHRAALARNDTELYRVLDLLCDELRESHLVPLPPVRSHEIRTSRRMAVGMGWMALEGRQVITEIIPGGPAAEAGVQPGWILITCEGRPLTDAPPLSPQPGRPVTYGFLDHNNEPRSITFQPELLPIDDQLVSQPLPGGYRYLRFDRFDRQTLVWLNRQLKAHRDAPGVVIDLRENPGGFIYTANLAIAQFFDHTVSTGSFVRRSGRTSEGRGWPIFSAKYRGRVAVLTGSATGSAAEIFAHVLQFEKRATVVGRRTAGAVVISRTYGLPGGGTLQLPIQDYRGRDGRRLEGHGVTPDIGVRPIGLMDIRKGRDQDVETALTVLGAPKDVIASASHE
jgi:carboxyl-terminal processing protease